MEWVSGAEILVHAGVSAPTPVETEWSDACAAAVSAGIDARLAGIPIVATVDYPELVVAARGAGVEAYKRKEAVFGITGYVDLQGAAVRVSRDYLDAIAPILERYATRGIA